MSVPEPRVIVFSNVLRGLPRNSLKAMEFAGKKVQPPSPRPHVDFTPSNAKELLLSRIPGSGGASAVSAVEIEEMIEASSRGQVLGIWKPLKPVGRDPLVLIDSRSEPDGDYCDLSLHKSTKPFGREMKWVLPVLKHGWKQHRWHFLSDMQSDEVFLFKHFDLKRDIPA
jgi:hypothetical protein